MGGAAILHAVRRSNGMQALRFFSWLVQRTPASYEPEVLACVALTAWLAGDGAFSWTAVDRCKELRPGTTLVRSIEPLLANAVPPQMWDEVVKA